MLLEEKINIYKKELANRKELYVRVKARPGSARSVIKEILTDETVKIDIAAPPEKGRANEELIRFLAAEFNVGKQAVSIISGRTEKTKLIKIKI